MNLSSWLLDEISRSALMLRTLASGGLIMVAVTVVWSLVVGEITPALAYPLLAFASSGLLGLGLLRGGHTNIPVVLGTVVAIAGASIWLFEVTHDLARENWARPAYSLWMAGYIVILCTSVALQHLAETLGRRCPQTIATSTLAGFLIFLAVGLIFAYPVGLHIIFQ